MSDSLMFPRSTISKIKELIKDWREKARDYETHIARIESESACLTGDDEEILCSILRARADVLRKVADELEETIEK